MTLPIIYGMVWLFQVGCPEPASEKCQRLVILQCMAICYVDFLRVAMRFNNGRNYLSNIYVTKDCITSEDSKQTFRKLMIISFLPISF